jgi:hypothetical protein
MAFAIRQGKLGGGGHIAGFDISPDGTTRIALNDTTGGFFWYSPTTSNNPVTDTAGYWRNLWTSANVPAYSPHSIPGFHGRNVYSAACAPSDPEIVYAAWPNDNNGGLAIGKVLKSTDRCATWSYTAFAAANLGQTYGHFVDRLRKPHMAVDPQNPDVVWLGGPTGIWWYTFDGGANWSTLSTSEVPLGSVNGASTAGPNPLVVFDGNSALTSGRSSIMYIASGGNGVYKSTDGGVNFTAMAGGPDWAAAMYLDSLGRLYVLRFGAPSGGSDNDDLYWLDGSSWTHSTVEPSVNQHLSSFAVNPFDTDEIFVCSDAGQMMRSTNRGVSWTAFYDHVPTRIATDIPWLAYTFENFFTNCDLKFDPVVDGRLWVSNGIGIWYYDRPSNFGASPTAQTWTELTRGNDGLIVSAMTKAPGGALNMTVWDRTGFRLPDADEYPAEDARELLSLPIKHGWSIDYASDPSPHTTFLARIAEDPYYGYSTDDGATWTQFSGGLPGDSDDAGCIACSTATNFVFVEGYGGGQFYTTDGGATWDAVTWKSAALATLSQDFFNTGFVGFFSMRKPLVADRVTAGTFYAYHWSDDGAAYAGFWKSTDGGENFIKQAAADLPAFLRSTSTVFKMAAVPGNAGHVFVSMGFQFSSSLPEGVDLYFTDDGFATIETGLGFTSVINVALGKEAPGGTYPAVYVYGQRDFGGDDDVPGLYRCTDWDGARTWELVADARTVDITVDSIYDLVADPDVYGRVYLGFASTGYAIGELTGTRTIRLRGI